MDAGELIMVFGRILHCRLCLGLIVATAFTGLLIAQEKEPAVPPAENAPNEPAKLDAVRSPHHISEETPLLSCTSGCCATAPMSCTDSVTSKCTHKCGSRLGIARLWSRAHRSCTAGGCTNGGCTAGGCVNGCCATDIGCDRRVELHDIGAAMHGCKDRVKETVGGAAGRAFTGTDRRADNSNASHWTGRSLDGSNEPYRIGSLSEHISSGWDSCRYCGRRCQNWCCCDCEQFFARNRHNSEIIHAHTKGKLAYFIPMGNGGEGVPNVGWYHHVYAADPGYFDPRDGGVYAAQGYGVPISVPLPPTVRHTMNYSAGMPASRLTPISNVVQPRRRR